MLWPESLTIEQSIPTKGRISVADSPCDPGHQKQVSGLGLHVQNTAHLLSVDNHELTGGAIYGHTMARIPEVPDAH